jgi:NTP pyrophosphatase (non-canonical NTP hydrolase)
VLRELDEFEEALESNLPTAHSTAPEELADVALYLIMVLGDLNAPGLATADVENVPTLPKFPMYARERTKHVARHVTRAFETWRCDGNPMPDLRVAFEETMALAVSLDIDLEAECVAKMAKNATRRHRHGGKHPDT